MSDHDITAYISSMSLACRMLNRGLINKKEYTAFEEKMRIRYGLEKTSIYRDYRLICVPARAGIRH